MNMSNCCNQYLGLFCKDSGGTVAGYACFKNGVPVIKYYDIETGIEYLGVVLIKCNNNVRVKQIVLAASQQDFTDPLFALIKIDPISSLRMMWVSVNTGSAPIDTYIENASGSPHTFSFTTADTIHLSSAINAGSIIEIKFFY